MIIGLGYRARVGKDTIAEYLSKVHGFKRIAFADTLKEACRQIFSFTYEQLYGNKKEVVDEYWGLTPRYILQKIGTECLRNGFDENIWVRAVERKIKGIEGNWVITDMRFPNEAAAIQKWGGFLVRVDRPSVSARGGIEGHASETSMDLFDEWDYVIHNPGTTFELFYKETEVMLEYLKQSGA